MAVEHQYCLVPASVPERTPLSSGTFRDVQNFLVEAFVEDDCFQSLIALVIMANATVIGFETDMPEMEWLWSYLEHCFLLLFTSELALRIVAEGNSFFTHPKDRWWNMFDLLVVGSGCLDLLMSLICMKDDSGFGQYATLMRTFRMLRILRVFRLFKMLKQLHLLATGFIGSMVSLFWVTVLCMILLYVCAILVTRTLGRRAIGAELHERFATVPITMFTLFRLMADPDLGSVEGVMFSDTPDNCNKKILLKPECYKCAAKGPLDNCIIDVWDKGMIEQGEDHKEQMLRDRRSRQDAFIGHLQEYLSKTDQDGDGLISKKEFRDGLNDMVKLFEAQGMTYAESELEMVYALVDFSGDGDVEFDEFIKAMGAFVSTTQEVPVQVMKMRARMFKRLKLVEQHVTSELEGVNQMVADANKALDGIDWRRIHEELDQTISLQVKLERRNMSR